MYTNKSIKPPPPKICGYPNGPPVELPRIRLSDGRHLAYRERGVPKENAKYINLSLFMALTPPRGKNINLPLTQV